MRIFFVALTAGLLIAVDRVPHVRLKLRSRPHVFGGLLLSLRRGRAAMSASAETAGWAAVMAAWRRASPTRP